MQAKPARLIAALIRHGDYHQLKDTPSAYQPFPLTAKGKSQAQQGAIKIGNFLERQQIVLAEEMDSSTLLRAYQTADEIRQALPSFKPQHRDFDALTERCVGASCANLTSKQIQELVKQDPRHQPLPEHWKSDSHFRLPFEGAESLLDAGKRVAIHINLRMSALRYSTEQDTLKLFIGHGAAFRHAAHHLGVLEFEQIAKLSMYHCEPVYLELMPDNGWRHIAGDWKVRKKHNQYTD